MIIYGLIFDVSMVTGTGSSREISTSKIIKITAIKKIVMRRAAVRRFFGSNPR
jgi:hypothetical protein